MRAERVGHAFERFFEFRLSFVFFIQAEMAQGGHKMGQRGA